MARKRTVELVLKGKDMLTGALGRAKRGVGGFVSGTVGKLSKLKNSIFSISNAMAGAFTGLAAKMFFSPSIKMETFNTQWAVLLGSVDAAESRMRELTDFAASTPFQLEGVAQASRTLETLTKGALSTGDGLKMVGDVAAGTSQPIGELSVWFGRLYDGIQSGRPVGEAMARLQELGVISGEVRGRLEDMKKSGASGAEMWNVVTQSVQKYNGMMEKMSQTTAGKLSTLKDNFNLALGDVSKEILPTLNRAIDDVLAEIEDLRASGDLQRWGKAAGEALETTVEGIKSLCIWIKANKGTLKTLGLTMGGVLILGKITKYLYSARAALIAFKTAANLSQATDAIASTTAAASKLAVAGKALATAGVWGVALTAAAAGGWALGKAIRSCIPALREYDKEVAKAEQSTQKAADQLEKLHNKFDKVNKVRLGKLFNKTGTTSRALMSDDQKNRYDVLQGAMSEKAFDQVTKSHKRKFAKQDLISLFDSFDTVDIDYLSSRGLSKNIGHISSIIGESGIEDAKREFLAQRKKENDKRIAARKYQEQQKAAAAKAEHEKTHFTDAQIKGMDNTVLSKRKEKELRKKLEVEIVPILKKVQADGVDSLDDRQAAIFSFYQQQLKKDADAAKKAEADQFKKQEAAGTARKRLSDYRRELKMTLKMEEADRLANAINRNVNSIDSLTAAIDADKAKVEQLRARANMTGPQLRRLEKAEEKEAKERAKNEKKLIERAGKARKKLKTGEKLSSREKAALEFDNARRELARKENKRAALRKQKQAQEKQLAEKQKEIDNEQKRQTRRQRGEKLTKLKTDATGKTRGKVAKVKREVNRESNKKVNPGKEKQLPKQQKPVIDRALLMEVADSITGGRNMSEIYDAMPGNLFENIKG